MSIAASLLIRRNQPVGRLEWSFPMLSFKYYGITLSLLCLVTATQAAPVSEEATRYMTRGSVAVEMAKTPEDLNAALEEYRRASEAAPQWADAYFNLGLIQERLGKFGDAARSLQKYLELNPSAPDAAQVREQIYKLEYKAEQTLSVDSIIEVLTSNFGNDPNHWQTKVIGNAINATSPCGRNWSYEELAFTRDNTNSVRALADVRYYPVRRSYQSLVISGPKLKYRVLLNICSAEANREFGNCDSVVENEITVLSRAKVQLQQTTLRPGFSPITPGTGQRAACIYERKSGM